MKKIEKESIDANLNDTIDLNKTVISEAVKEAIDKRIQPLLQHIVAMMIDPDNYNMDENIPEEDDSS